MEELPGGELFEGFEESRCRGGDDPAFFRIGVLGRKSAFFFQVVGQGGACLQVVRKSEGAQGGHQYPHGAGGVDQQAFRRLYRDPVGGEVFGDLAAVAVGTVDHGDVAVGIPVKAGNAVDFLQDGEQGRLPAVFEGTAFEGADGDEAFSGGFGLLMVALLVYPAEGLVEGNGGDEGEKFVGEIDDHSPAAVVGGQVFYPVLFGGESSAPLVQVDELPGVSAPPAVDGLFGIAYDEPAAVLSQLVVHQGADVVPLEGGGVLEFVDKVMLVAFAQFFVDERDGLLTQVPADDLVEFREEHHPAALFDGIHLRADLGSDAHLAQGGEYHLGVSVGLAVRLQQGGDLLGQSAQGLVLGSYGDPLFRRGGRGSVLAGQELFHGRGIGVQGGDVAGGRLAEKAGNAVGSSGQDLIRAEFLVNDPAGLQPHFGYFFLDLGQVVQQTAAQRQVVAYFLSGQFFQGFVGGLFLSHPCPGQQQGGDVPAVAVVHVVQHEVQEHFGEFSVAAGAQQQQIDGLAQDLVGIHHDVEAYRQVQFVGKAPYQPRGKRVDRPDGKGRIVVEDRFEDLSGPLPKHLRGKACLFEDLFPHAACALPPGEAFEGGEDAVLHLPGRFVGKGDGQYLAVRIRPGGGEEQDEVFPHQGKGLSRSGRSVIDLQLSHRLLVCPKGTQNLLRTFFDTRYLLLFRHLFFPSVFPVNQI